jgi:hypothetical protein
MGGNFAFPKEIYNVNTKEIQTIYDGSMWNNDSGVVSLQIGFMGGTLFNSCKVIGRPKDNKYIQPPRLLFI